MPKASYHYFRTGEGISKDDILWKKTKEKYFKSQNARSISMIFLRLTKFTKGVWSFSPFFVSPTAGEFDGIRCISFANELLYPNHTSALPGPKGTENKGIFEVKVCRK